MLIINNLRLISYISLQLFVGSRGYFVGVCAAADVNFAPVCIKHVQQLAAQLSPLHQRSEEGLTEGDGERELGRE